MEKTVIYKKIEACVNNSIKMRYDPIPGASLVFSKPSPADYDGYNNVKKELGLVFLVCS